MHYSDDVIKIEIVSQSSIGTYVHSDIKFFFCLHGEIVVTCQEKKSILGKEGIIIVNSGDKHSFTIKKDAFAAVLYVSSEYITRITSNSTLRFQCDSSKPPEYDYEQLRDLIKKILSVHVYQRWQERMKEQQYINMLITILLKNYAVWEAHQERVVDDSKRIQTIIEFINRNYNRQIGLRDLADILHVTIPYLSKYIKQNLKMGFVDYLNNIRLSHTIDDLNYTDHSMTRIAFDNGFASLTSFNRVFKEAFCITPSDYRKRSGNREKKEVQKVEDTNINLLKGYLKENPIVELEMTYQNQLQCIVDAQQKVRYRKNWDKVWNLGSAEELLRAEVQEHVLLLKKELGFKTVRIWGVFSKEMLIHMEMNQKFNFSRIDQVFDFIIENQMIPFIDMGFHPKELYSRDRTILYQERESGYENLERYKTLITEFVKHCIKRYGEESTDNWVFEQSKDDRLFLHGGKAFFNLFETVSQCIKSLIPKAKVGGGAIFVYDNLEILEEFISGWMKRELRPDFLSVWIYPYDVLQDGEKTKKLNTSSNPDYICDKLNQVNKKMQLFNADNIPIYVTRWDMSVSCRNFLNESCYRAVYLLKNIVACLDKSEVMSCFGSTDLLCEYYDTVEPLNGGYGLITKNEIKKPAFYSFYFLKKMGKNLLAKGENYFITTDDNGNIAILLFNCCRMEMGYYYQQQDDLPVEKVQELFEKEELEIQVQINNIANGRYLIKKSYLKPEEGSVLEEWRKLGYKTHLEKDELQYMKSICIPRMQYETREATKESLKMQILLTSNEMQLIQIEKEYE